MKENEKMRELERRQKISNWYENNNHHPKDNEMFYDIVIETINEKLSLSEFEEIIKDENEACEIYNHYEDLYNFLKYFKKKEENNYG